MGSAIVTFDLRPVNAGELEAVRRMGGAGIGPGTSWILVGATKAGVLDVEVREKDTLLRGLVVAPDMRRRGLGTLVVEELKIAAARRWHSIRVQVGEGRQFYERLGFVPEDGETMVWRPIGCA